MTLASASGLSALAIEPVKTSTYQVKGFTCIACAIGLDTMLAKERGVKSSHSTYPEGIVKVAYNPEQTSDGWIVGFITNLGSTVSGKS